MTNTIRLGLLSGWYSFRALFSWNSPGLFVTVLVLTPLLQTLFFALLGDSLAYQTSEFFVLGNGIQSAAAAGVGGLVAVIANERQFGTLSHLLAAPASKSVVFLGRALPGVILGVLVSVMTITIGLILTGAATKLHLLALWILPIAVVAFSSAGLGLALSAFGLMYRDIYQIATAAGLLLLVVSGANIEREDLPLPLAVIGSVLPQSNGIAAARLIATEGLSPTAAGLIGLEAAVGAVWLAVALMSVEAMSRVARRRATIELY